MRGYVRRLRGRLYACRRRLGKEQSPRIPRQEYLDGVQGALLDEVDSLRSWLISRV